MSGGDLEVEVKFRTADRHALRQRLIASGAVPHHPRIFERNIRYDNGWDGLMRKGQLLRLRQDAATRLTFKGPAPQPEGTEVKIREELEVTVDDFATADRLLRRLGFEPRQVYEKYRETFRLGEVEIVLDELPFGDFVELEGPEPALRETADLLGLDWARRILDTYLMLMARLKRHHEFDFDDLTFDRFDGFPWHIDDVLA